MATVTNTMIIGVYHGQAAQADRTEWTPGKANPGYAEHLGKDFRVPTGNPVFDEATNGSLAMYQKVSYETEMGVIGDDKHTKIPSVPEDELYDPKAVQRIQHGNINITGS